MAKSKPKKSTGGYKAGQGTGPQVAAAISEQTKAKGGGSDDTTLGELLVKKRHPDWMEHEMDWRRFQDSLEGGARYRNAVYGFDRRGLPNRNLFRHKREYPDPQEFPNNNYGFSGYAGGGGGAGTGVTDATYGPFPGMIGADAAATAADDAYEARRSRTPVPSFTKEVVGIWGGKIFDQDISREGPQCLLDWWKDVDGCGTPMDDYMRETIYPLLVTVGLSDVTLDRPRAPEGVKVETRKQEEDLKLNRCVASYILAENLVWWRSDNAGRFTECLIREYVDASDRKDHDEDGNPVDPEDEGEAGQAWRRDYVRWRHWTATESTLYSYDGKHIHETIPHNYGMVPIPRLIDKKKHRTRMVGSSRCEAIIDYERAYYNKDSELTISDTLQALPLLSGPEDFCKADNTVSVGPNYLLPKKKIDGGTAYEGFEYVSPPKDPAASLRQNNLDIIDAKDRLAGLTKPAGVQGTTGGSVGQSGISKQLDSVSGNKILTDLARSLAKAERTLAIYAFLVLQGRMPTPAELETIVIGYPTKFELHSADEIIDALAKLQSVMEAAGNAPGLEREMIEAAYKQILPGMNDEAYREIDAEIEELVEAKNMLNEKIHEMNTDIIDNANVGGEGSDQQAGGEDDTGQSGSTAVSGISALMM